MKFGTLQGVLGEPLPEVFQTAKELGFDGVELDWNDPAQAKGDGPLSPGKRAGIREAAQNAGVEIPSVCAHFLNRGGIASGEREVWEAGMEAVREGVQLCSDLGAKVLLVPFFGPAELSDQHDMARLTESLRELAPVADDADVTIAIEHTLPGDIAAEILNGLGSPNIGDYFDMGNAMCLGFDPVMEVGFLGDRIAQVHAKEFVREGDPKERGKGHYPGLNPLPLGEGQVPISDVLAALKRNDYDGYIVLETGAFGDRKESARKALELLRRLT